MATNKYDTNEYTRAHKRKRTTTMDVPEERAEEVRRLLERLDMKDAEDEEVKHDKTEDQYEVTSVCDHQVRRGKFIWKVRWKGFPSPEWIKDEDCNCEKKIQEYLAENTNIRTIYGICRISSKSQLGPTHVSLNAQEAILRKTARALDVKEDEAIRVKIYHIVGSAYSGIHSKLSYIAEVARARDILLVYRVDRLSRNIVKFLSLLEDMNDRGVLIYAQDEDIWYHNRHLDFLQAVLNANKESAIISRRVRLSINHRRQRGDYIGGVAYGWRLQRDKNGKVSKVKNPEEQKIIARIKKCTDETEMAENLNREGTKKRGRIWTPAMIAYVVANN